MIQAVVFDLDDTLIQERVYAFSGFAAVAEKYADILGDPKANAATMEELFDTEHRPRVFNALLETLGVAASDELIRSMIDTYRRHAPFCWIIPDADAALTRLNRRRLGIITDGPIVQQQNKLVSLGILPRVDEAILTEELGPGFAKPHPRAFELMAERLGADHSQCVYVGDNPAKDFVAPNALHWTTVRILRPEPVYIYRDAPTAEGGAPHHVIASLDELDALLD